MTTNARQEELNMKFLQFLLEEQPENLEIEIEHVDEYGHVVLGFGVPDKERIKFVNCERRDGTTVFFEYEYAYGFMNTQIRPQVTKVMMIYSMLRVVNAPPVKEVFKVFDPSSW
jgi:hypothetical protein